MSLGLYADLQSRELKMNWLTFSVLTISFIWLSIQTPTLDRWLWNLVQLVRQHSPRCWRCLVGDSCERKCAWKPRLMAANTDLIIFSDLEWKWSEGDCCCPVITKPIRDDDDANWGWKGHQPNNQPATHTPNVFLKCCNLFYPLWAPLMVISVDLLYSDLLGISFFNPYCGY